MVDDFVTLLGSNRVLTRFNFRIHKLDDFVGIDINHMIVVIIARQLKDRVAGLKIMPLNEARGFELCQHAIYSGQANIITRIPQTLINVFCTEVRSLIGRFAQNRENIEPWKRYFEARTLKVDVLITHKISSKTGNRVMMPAAPSTEKAIVVYRTRLIIGLSLILSTVTLSGCSGIGFPGVYLINIDQGNIVEQDMVDQLKPDMTRRQVRFLLGTPIVEDTFNNDRWDYIRVVRRGNDTLLRRRLTVVFEDDVLVDVEGDYVSENWPEPDPEEPAEESGESSEEIS